MRDASAPVVVNRTDYAAPPYRILSVELVFDLDPAKTLVSSRMLIERDSATPPGEPLRLHGEELTLLRVLADGQSVSFSQDAGLLVIEPPAEAARFTLEIRNTCAPEKNTQLSGLYTSGGGFFTQCEAEGFRRITYFADRPDVMAVYTVTLRADRKTYPVLLSNGNLLEQGELEGGRHYAKWHDPHPKPSYLFALVAADLVAREQRIRSRAGTGHLLQVYVRRGDLDKTEHAMASLIASVAWDEARFGLPLDLERFMVVAVGDFNMGAMENKGLNIFNTKYVLANPASATDVDFAGIESVVAHEYFHNWTGNRVTCRDWFQLSLKEGLTVFRDQEFSMDMAGEASARAVKRIEDVRALRMAQFPEDAGPMAHPVRPERYAAIDNFYTATVYEKGAEVVRMMHTLLGREGFRRGMDLYFQRHDGQAVTCDDFAQAMADANPGSALSHRLEPFKRWYSQAGTPRLRAHGAWDPEVGTYTLTLEQARPLATAAEGALPYVIPVLTGLVAADGRALSLHMEGEREASSQQLLVLDSPKQSWVFSGLHGLQQAPVPSLLRGFSAPVLLDDGLQPPQLRTLLQHDQDPFNRWEAAQRLIVARVRDSLSAPMGAPVLDADLVQALRSVLRDKALDPAFKELVLNMPSERELFDLIEQADPARVNAVREALLDQLAADLREDWAWAFDAHQVREGYRPDAQQSGMRALANLALAMRVRVAVREGDAVEPGRAYQRFKDATNMTERMGALQALLGVHAELAQPALERMHALFRGDALVMDKWFMVQARAPESDGRVFARVNDLLGHPDFSLRNPNRARALLFAWHTNPAAFHRRDGAGYALWAQKVIEIDSFNPQLAARLARALDRWSALPDPYRSLARDAIASVAARDSLSADTREIVSRALQGA